MHISMWRMTSDTFGSLPLKCRTQVLGSNVDLVEVGLDADIAPSALPEVLDETGLISGHDSMEYAIRKASLGSATRFVCYPTA